MTDTENFSTWHEARLQEFLNETMPDPTDVRAIARELNVLPLMFEMSGCFAIQSDGKIISFLRDEPQNIRQENDPRIRNITLFQGSKKYPDLLALIPPRLPDATTCWHCGGTGIEPFSAKHGLDFIVCYCGGLGWIPPES